MPRPQPERTRLLAYLTFHVTGTTPRSELHSRVVDMLQELKVPFELNRETEDAVTVGFRSAKDVDIDKLSELIKKYGLNVSVVD